MSLLPPLPTISLTELAARAELLTRVDRKYLMPYTAAVDILATLAEVASTGQSSQVLQVDGRTVSGYASTYFDTEDGESFWSTATARRRRWKVRTRSYLDSGDCWVEVKTRGPRGRTVKERTPHPRTYADRLTAPAVAFVTERLIAARAHHGPFRAHPVLHTTYDRSTVLLPDGCSRVTIDTGLTWQLPDGTVAAPRDLVILETKTTGPASSLDRALWRAGVRPSRLSKFGTGLALLDPDLPAHRWHRLLADGGVLAG